MRKRDGRERWASERGEGRERKEVRLNIMLLNNDSRADKLHEIIKKNIISSLFVNENIFF